MSSRKRDPDFWRPLCDYCRQPTQLVGGETIYEGRRPDLDHLKFWHCSRCKAWVGCHKGSYQPFGRLADQALRWRKQLAHDAFDPLWQKAMRLRGWSKKQARSKAYQWLAGQMAMDVRCCHIGLFNIDQCELVIRICKGVRLKHEEAADKADDRQP